MQTKKRFLGKASLAMMLSASMAFSAAAASVGTAGETVMERMDANDSSDQPSNLVKAGSVRNQQGNLATSSNAELATPSNASNDSATPSHAISLLKLEKEPGYDWESVWEDDLTEGDIVTRLDFSSSTDPGDVMEPLGGATNIEGPLGNNCFTQGADNWQDNGNLKVVSLASCPDAEWDGAGKTAKQSLNDKSVFRFFLHKDKDFDRNTNKTDRQRIELRTSTDFSQEEDPLNSYAGDVVTNRWKFYLPSAYGLPESGSFFHIFQTKAVKGDEASLPLFTLSLTKDNLIFYGTDCGHAYQNRPKILDIDVDEIRDKWIQAEVTVYTADKGHVYISLYDLSDPKAPVLIDDAGMDFDTWRRPEKKMEDGKWYEYDEPATEGQKIRTKWGLYRSNKSPKPFTEMVMYLGDLQVIKRGPEYVFPDDFSPKDVQKEVTWVNAPQPLEVLIGTEFTEIGLPSTVEYYVDGYDKQVASVTWDNSTYHPDVPGSYTIYGSLDLEDDIENPEDIRPSIEVVVVKELSEERINWALSEAAGGTARIKTICGGTGTDADNLIDGDTTTSWITDQGLVKKDEEDNGGYRYWAAIDLGEERSFDEIYYELGTIGQTRWYRLKYLDMYMANETAAWDDLISGGTGNPRENGTTPDPLATSHGNAWKKIPGVRKNNTGENGELCNNVKYNFELEEAVKARYVLVYGEIENVDCIPGIIQAKDLKLIGTKPSANSTPEEPQKPTHDYSDDDDSDDDDSSDIQYSNAGSNAGHWEMDEKGWKYHFNNGTLNNGKWCQLIWNGKLSWYHFDEDGYMTTGWYQNPYGGRFYLNPVSDGTKGEMFIGWHQIDGIWYYFREIADNLQGVLEQEDKNRS